MKKTLSTIFTVALFLGAYSANAQTEATEKTTKLEQTVKATDAVAPTTTKIKKGDAKSLPQSAKLEKMSPANVNSGNVKKVNPAPIDQKPKSVTVNDVNSKAIKTRTKDKKE
jgi:hypothetical protein